MSRPGSEEAAQLFEGALGVEWKACLDRYQAAVACVAEKKRKPELVQLDNFLWGDLVRTAGDRKPVHITHEELAGVMKWKLARGKARPLQKLVESNSPSAVEEASAKALALVSKGKWEAAVGAITVLKGIGPATATAVLAPFAPALVPFMADEVMEATGCQRDYTLPVYKIVRSALLAKAGELGPDWTAEGVGKALWVRAMMELFPQILRAKAPTSLPTTGAEVESKGDKKGAKEAKGESGGSMRSVGSVQVELEEPAPSSKRKAGRKAEQSTSKKQK
ncbi:hypothetical protein B484DRAFT_443069 [Ochromonadaceae sp. CCMP2298]|nr:hypothetical protein B484DRAFT_443069 [Ochromonadaceae sp. CCMP2298]